MSNTSRIHDKFERFLYKVRGDNQPGIRLDNLKYESQESKDIGYFTYDFKNKTEKYTPLNKEE
jgi:hypothetical protein